MDKYSLHFGSVNDICSFIKIAGLSNFLLLGKKSILIGRFTDFAIRLAKERYQAEVVDNAELMELSALYFSKSPGIQLPPRFAYS